MTWAALSTENLRAARLLNREGHPRASVTRSYYAAYCAIAAELDKRGYTTFGRFNNPSHAQLARLIAHNIGFTPVEAVQLDRTVSSLRLARDAANVLIDLGIAIM